MGKNYGRLLQYYGVHKATREARRKGYTVRQHTDGSLAIDAVGFTGTDCTEATAFLEDALGEPVTSRKKPEYNQHRTMRREQRLGR